MICWGLAGPYVADWMEERYGFKPKPEEETLVDKYTPRVVPIERKQP